METLKAWAPVGISLPGVARAHPRLLEHLCGTLAAPTPGPIVRAGAEALLQLVTCADSYPPDPDKPAALQRARPIVRSFAERLG